jgi:GTP-binding protein LepA
LQIRNFSIIAHIDHGKSTLADRLLQATHAVSDREAKEQLLDSMDLERERGITIKASAVTVKHMHNGEEFMLNFIDTPGHVDFGYEVSRALKACEGAILIVDASQGVEAQTVVNAYLAVEQDLEIIPVLNKIDLPGAEPERRRDELVELLGVDPDDVLAVSAKEGTGVDELLEAVVQRIPPPKGDRNAPLRALIFDSYYDRYQGAIPTVRVVDGVLKKGMRITFGAADGVYPVDEVGYLRVGRFPTEELGPGEVGYVLAGIKRVSDTRSGDTILDADNRAAELLPGFLEV